MAILACTKTIMAEPTAKIKPLDFPFSRQVLATERLTNPGGNTPAKAEKKMIKNNFASSKWVGFRIFPVMEYFYMIISSLRLLQRRRFPIRLHLLNRTWFSSLWKELGMR